jgi:hypothetical protein
MMSKGDTFALPLFMAALNLVLLAVCFLITERILSKKLNLE